MACLHQIYLAGYEVNIGIYQSEIALGLHFQQDDLIEIGRKFGRVAGVIDPVFRLDEGYILIGR